jgi:hypothetical protein
MAIIKSIDNERKGFILQELDEQTALISPDKIEQLERLVKEVRRYTFPLQNGLLSESL